MKLTLWVASVVRRDVSLVDPWWSMAFLLVTVHTVARTGLTPGKALLLVAHEISGTLAIYEVAAVCDTLGDINADCVVAGDDLGQLLNNWGGPGVGDLNADGTVGADDLAILLNNWG